MTSGLGLFASNVVMHPIMSASADATGRHAWAIPFLVAFLAAAVLTVFAALFFRPAEP